MVALLERGLAHSPERKYTQSCGDENYGEHNKQEITHFLKLGIICHFGSL